MMFMGMFTLVVLPLFLVVSARMIATGEHRHQFETKIGVVVLYFFAAINIATGIWFLARI